jgi:hypothetical protein
MLRVNVVRPRCVASPEPVTDKQAVAGPQDATVNPVVVNVAEKGTWSAACAGRAATRPKMDASSTSDPTSQCSLDDLRAVLLPPFIDSTAGVCVRI